MGFPFLSLRRISFLFYFSGFRHEGAIRTHAWDLRNTLMLRDFLWCVPEGEKRDLIQGILDDFEQVVQPNYEACSVGVYQCDFNDANMIVNEEETEVSEHVLFFTVLFEPELPPNSGGGEF